MFPVPALSLFKDAAEVMLICLQDISAMLEQEPRDHQDKTFAVLTVQQQCVALFSMAVLRIVARLRIQASASRIGREPHILGPNVDQSALC